MATDILVVDDETDIRVLTSGILEDEGYTTRMAANSTEALQAIEQRRPGLILLDIWLQGSELDGIGILKAVRANHPSVPVLMMSGHGTVETAVSAIKEGAYDFIEKPFKTDRLVLLVERAIEATRLRRENDELRLKMGDENNQLVGLSPAIAKIQLEIERVAPVNSRILITGPSGSGKEVVARLIHQSSARANGPLVVVNCATLNPDTFEPELFGTEQPRQTGTFEVAHNGTLFLDEVANMPLETQGKIARILQEQMFQRVGGNSRVEVDVRVIASTSKDLTVEISEGRFREDLFYRLSVVPLTLPSLRERREDIPFLIDSFMSRGAESLGLQQRTLNEEAIASLQAYDWPGNVRELRNVIERLLIMAPGEPGDPISTDHLPGEISNRNADDSHGDTPVEMMGVPLRDAREMFEREYLLAQVTRFGGNISRTADFVGMERSALHRKLKNLGITNDERLRATGD